MKSRRRKNVIVKEVSLVDSPATRKKFVFFKNNKKEVDNMDDKELEFVDPEDKDEKKVKKDQELAQLKEVQLQTSNSIKGSINNVNKILSDMAKSVGFKYNPKFHQVSSETSLDDNPDTGGQSLDEVINAFDSKYGDGAETVKGVFQGLSQVVMSMAESVGFTASMSFSKEAKDPEPEKEPEPAPDETQGDKSKKKDDDEELTDEEKVLCDELEGLIEELSSESITPERYMEILERKGVIEDKLKGGDK